MLTFLIITRYDIDSYRYYVTKRKKYKKIAFFYIENISLSLILNSDGILLDLVCSKIYMMSLLKINL